MLALTQELWGNAWSDQQRREVEENQETYSSFVRIMFRFANAPVEALAARAAMIDKRIFVGDRRCVTSVRRRDVERYE